jgi:hypothetical protein
MVQFNLATTGNEALTGSNDGIFSVSLLRIALLQKRRELGTIAVDGAIVVQHGFMVFLYPHEERFSDHD